MERILDHLKARADAAPHDELLKDTIALLGDLQRRPDTASWEILHRNFEQLRDRGHWEGSAANDALLDALHTSLTRGGPPLGEKISIVVPPTQILPSQLVSSQDPLVLPVELIDLLNKAYFLHVLATDSGQVLPPGKSLLSVMSRPHTTPDGDTKLSLRSKVEDLVHKAFWDEAVATLSNPEPSVQLPRIKLLYADLHVALSPLLPPKRPILVTLSSPLSPTSSPLDSALIHLREVIASLRERCAPVRDPEIEALLQQLSDPPVRSSSPVALATLVAETFRNILKLCEIMKDDLSQFVLGSMTEQQLKSVVAKQAKTTEREIVIDVWHRDRIAHEWTTWLSTQQLSTHLTSLSAAPRFAWIVRIVHALGAPSPVSCPLPSRTVQISADKSSSRGSDETAALDLPKANSLPPVFFFSAPTLLKIQNYLQALVIAASLRILTRLPLPTRASDPPDPSGFMSRVWTLLRAEIAGEPDASDTKLIHLADEVVRARMQAAPGALSKEDEATLRAAVDRTLRPEDPVYTLLQRRLFTELADVLVKRRQGETGRGASTGPATLRTGRDGERAGKRPRLVLDPEDMDEAWSSNSGRGVSRVVADLKGFEDPVLSHALSEVFQLVDDCLRWVESIWGDVIATGSVKNVGSPPKNDA